MDYKDGEECSRGCANHTTHLCEKCGRINANIQSTTDYLIDKFAEYLADLIAFQILYKKITGKKIPGSDRTKRLRKKKMSRLYNDFKKYN